MCIYRRLLRERMVRDWVLEDSLANLIVFLSLIVVVICFVCRDKDYNLKYKNLGFSLILSLVSIICVIFFIVGGFLLFYFFFEASLIPTLLLILGWGYQPERLQAGFYIMLYTVSASMPLFVILC